MTDDTGEKMPEVIYVERNNMPGELPDFDAYIGNETWEGPLTKYLRADQLATLSKRVEKLEAALKFYAERDRYPDTEDYTRDMRRGMVMVAHDLGQIARKALEETK